MRQKIGFKTETEKVEAIRLARIAAPTPDNTQSQHIRDLEAASVDVNFVGEAYNDGSTHSGVKIVNAPVINETPEGSIGNTPSNNDTFPDGSVNLRTGVDNLPGVVKNSDGSWTYAKKVYPAKVVFNPDYSFTFNGKVYPKGTVFENGVIVE